MYFFMFLTKQEVFMWGLLHGPLYLEYIQQFNNNWIKWINKCAPWIWEAKERTSKHIWRCKSPSPSFPALGLCFTPKSLSSTAMDLSFSLSLWCIRGIVVFTSNMSPFCACLICMYNAINSVKLLSSIRLSRKIEQQRVGWIPSYGPGKRQAYRKGKLLATVWFLFSSSSSSFSFFSEYC